MLPVESVAAPEENPAFSCRQCGTCCRGRGGIILRRKDSLRLAAHLGLTTQEFMDRYTRKRQGKYELICGQDGCCVFFSSPGACAVHEARPDICRAWPFFRGNLIDEQSFALAAAYCPGINRECSFEQFVAEGREYLAQADLICRADEQDAPRALILETAAEQKVGKP